MHWGVEYRDKALPGVRKLAGEIVDLGGDVIVGHHPHWVQDFELINGVPVYYSLGNFVFDQMWSEKTREGMAVKLIFEDKKFKSDEMLQIYMKNHAQPQWITK
jgi:poly-gamma-glutamate synthesis protein (capsule biosynthesis protein)